VHIPKNWQLCVAALVVSLSACVSTKPLQCPPPAQPPAILMEPPPSPGDFQERLEAILKPSESLRTNATR
jgi:hypothetical protein